MEGPAISPSLVGAITFFLLLGIIAMVVIRETVMVILKPAPVIIVLTLLAVWAGLLDQTVVGNAFGWIGDRLIMGVEGVSSWVADAWSTRAGGG